MGKRNKDETEEEKQARKRAKKEAKKEAKKQKKEAKRQRRSTGSSSGDKIENKTAVANMTDSPAPKEGNGEEPLLQQQQQQQQQQHQQQQQSPYVKRKIQISVALYPSALENKTTFIKKQIRSLLLKYSEGIGGVLLAFDNLKFVGDGKGKGSLGQIRYELPHIHYVVEIDALVFCPKEGMKLTGKVNECYPSHVGLLIGSFFNAMVPSDHLRASGYVFDQDLQQWLLDTEEDSKVIGENDLITMKLEKLRECAGIISLEGSQPSLVKAET